MLRLLLATVLALELALEPATDPRSVAQDVAALLDQGDADAARARIESATQANPDPRFVYMRAALEEHVGRCDRAVPLYQAFLTEAGDPLDREEAEAGLRRCGAPTPAPPSSPPPPLAQLQTPPPPASREPSTPTDVPPQARWQRDATGWTLLGVGAAGGIAGGVLLGLASRSAQNANDAMQQSNYDAARLRVRPRRVGGAIALTAGTALVLGGVVRFVVVKRRGRPRRGDLSAIYRF